MELRVCLANTSYFVLCRSSSMYPILSEQQCLTLQGPSFLIRESSSLHLSHFQSRVFKKQLIYLEDLISLQNDL